MKTFSPKPAESLINKVIDLIKLKNDIFSIVSDFLGNKTQQFGVFFFQKAYLPKLVFPFNKADALGDQGLIQSKHLNYLMECKTEAKL